MAQSSQSMSMQSGSQCKPVPKKKQIMFSPKENNVLVRTVMAHANKLFGKNVLGTLERSSIWKGIARKVNKVSETSRTVISCRKRWNEYKRKIKNTINKTDPNTGKLKPKHWSKLEMLVIQYFRLDSGSENKTQQPSASASGKKAAAPPAPCPRPPMTMDSSVKAPPSQTKASAVSLPGPSAAQTPPLAQQQSLSPSKSTTPSCRKLIEEKLLKLQNDVEGLKQIICSHFDLLEQMSNK